METATTFFSIAFKHPRGFLLLRHAGGGQETKGTHPKGLNKNLGLSVKEKMGFSVTLYLHLSVKLEPAHFMNLFRSKCIAAGLASCLAVLPSFPGTTYALSSSPDIQTPLDSFREQALVPAILTDTHILEWWDSVSAQRRTLSMTALAIVASAGAGLYGYSHDWFSSLASNANPVGGLFFRNPLAPTLVLGVVASVFAARLERLADRRDRIQKDFEKLQANQEDGERQLKELDRQSASLQEEMAAHDTSLEALNQKETHLKRRKEFLESKAKKASQEGRTALAAGLTGVTEQREQALEQDMARVKTLRLENEARLQELVQQRTDLEKAMKGNKQLIARIQAQLATIDHFENVARQRVKDEEKSITEGAASAPASFAASLQDIPESMRRLLTSNSSRTRTAILGYGRAAAGMLHRAETFTQEQLSRAAGHSSGAAFGVYKHLHKFSMEDFLQWAAMGAPDIFPEEDRTTRPVSEPTLKPVPSAPLPTPAVEPEPLKPPMPTDSLSDLASRIRKDNAGSDRDKKEIMTMHEAAIHHLLALISRQPEDYLGAAGSERLHLFRTLYRQIDDGIREKYGRDHGISALFNGGKNADVTRKALAILTEEFQEVYPRMFSRPGFTVEEVSEEIAERHQPDIELEQPRTEIAAKPRRVSDVEATFDALFRQQGSEIPTNPLIPEFRAARQLHEEAEGLRHRGIWHRDRRELGPAQTLLEQAYEIAQEAAGAFMQLFLKVDSEGETANHIANQHQAAETLLAGIESDKRLMNALPLFDGLEKYHAFLEGQEMEVYEEYKGFATSGKPLSRDDLDMLAMLLDTAIQRNEEAQAAAATAAAPKKMTIHVLIEAIDAALKSTFPNQDIHMDENKFFVYVKSSVFLSALGQSLEELRRNPNPQPASMMAFVLRQNRDLAAAFAGMFPEHKNRFDIESEHRIDPERQRQIDRYGQLLETLLLDPRPPRPYTKADIDHQYIDNIPNPSKTPAQKAAYGELRNTDPHIRIAYYESIGLRGTENGTRTNGSYLMVPLSLSWPNDWNEIWQLDPGLWPVLAGFLAMGLILMGLSWRSQPFFAPVPALISRLRMAA